MKNIDHIKSHDKFAKSYDTQVKQYHSYGHEALFGMCYEYIQPGDALLDLGIGTGLSSVHFAKAGLHITGLDGSLEMLKECRKKGFAQEIKQYNIEDVPLPFPDKNFSHIVCCGVFHFFGDLWPTTEDAFRMLKPSGIFAFTIASLDAKHEDLDVKSMPDYIEVQSSWGIPLYKHSDKYIHKMAETLGLTIHKEQKVLADSGDKDVGDILFKIIVTQKTGNR